MSIAAIWPNSAPERWEAEPTPEEPKVRRAGVLLGVGDKLGRGLCWHRRIDHEDVGRRRRQAGSAPARGRCHRRHWHRRRARFDAKDSAGRCHQQRVAVGGRRRDRPRAQEAGRAGAIFGHDRRAPQRLQVNGEDAAEHVGRAARRERHDQAHRPARGSSVPLPPRPNKSPNYPGQPPPIPNIPSSEAAPGPQNRS